MAIIKNIIVHLFILHEDVFKITLFNIDNIKLLRTIPSPIPLHAHNIFKKKKKWDKEENKTDT